MSTISHESQINSHCDVIEDGGSDDGEGDYDPLYATEQEAEEEVDELESDREGAAPATTIVRQMQECTPPEVVKRTVRDIIHMLQMKKIDLEPEYQRGYVWSTGRRSEFMGSFLLGYSCLPVVFAIKDGQNEPIYVCLDGKQRLTTVQLWAEGKVLVKIPSQQRRTCNANTTSKEALSVKNAILDAPMWAIEYRNTNTTTEREIFQRLQQGSPLTTGEFLGSIAGSRLSYVQELRTTYFGKDDGTLRTCLKTTVDRGLDLELLVQLLSLMENSDTCVLQTGRAALAAWLANQETLAVKVKKDAKNVLENMVKWHIRRSKSSTKLSPLGFLGICLLLRSTPSQTEERLDTQIAKFQSDLKAHHPGSVRRNTACFKTVCELLREMKVDPKPQDASRANAITAAIRSLEDAKRNDEAERRPARPFVRTDPYGSREHSLGAKETRQPERERKRQRDPSAHGQDTSRKRSGGRVGAMPSCHQPHTSVNDQVHLGPPTRQPEQPGFSIPWQCHPPRSSGTRELNQAPSEHIRTLSRPPSIIRSTRPASAPLSVFAQPDDTETLPSILTEPSLMPRENGSTSLDQFVQGYTGAGVHFPANAGDELTEPSIITPYAADSDAYFRSSWMVGFGVPSSSRW